MTTTTTYKEQAFTYWQQAMEEFARGDLRQASEKGWGAASQMVKAVAASRGLSHETHRDLFTVVAGLNDPNVSAGFALANTLHTNFYEGWLNQDLVRQYLVSVGEFIRHLQELTDAR